MELKLVASNNTNPLPKTEAPTPVVDIARGVSHDLSNVLCWMNGYLQELREYCGPDGLPLIDEVVQASSEIEQLTKQLSQVGRPQQDDASKPINMGELFAQQAGFVGNLYPDIRIKLNIDTDSTVVGDEDKMKRVVQNLLVNACDAIPDTGTIELGAKKIDESTVHCWISDDGYGMPRTIQDKVFDRYFTTKGNKGSGIGLANVKQIVEEHGGNILLTSVVDQGTTFDLYLPFKSVNVSRTA